MSVSKARVFVPLIKVDEEQRLVHGVITAEEIDQAGEMMDYETSKPNFEKWSSQIEESSGGLSKGNLRVMHGLSVAGKLTDLAFDDEAKRIEVCAKIVDDAEWTKVLEGCYTGFSVGGKYAKKWNEVVDGQAVKKFTAVPNEVSLVDNPCVKSATFQLVKADGAEEEVSFSEEILSKGGMKIGDKKKAKKKGEEAKAEETEADDKKPAEKTVTNEQVAARATELAKAAGNGKVWTDFIEQAREELLKADEATDEGDTDEGEEEVEATEEPGEAEAANDDAGDAVEKVTPPTVTQKWVASDGTAFEKKADAVAHEESLTKAAEEAKPTAAEELAERLRKAEEPDQPEAEPTSIFSFERLGDLHKAVVELETPREGDDLAKGMYTVSRFAEMLRCAANLAETIKAEGKLEDDSEDEDVAAAMRDQVATWGETFVTYARQQVAEMVARLNREMSPANAYDYYYHAAGTGNDLAKSVVEMIDAVADEIPEAEENLVKAATLWGIVAPTNEETDDTLQKRFDALSQEHEGLRGEHDQLRKVAELAVEKVEDMAKRLKALEDKPEPRAPNANAIALKEGDGTFLGKAANTDEEKLAILEDMLKTHGADAMATMLIKASQASGGQQLSLKQ